MTTFAAEARAAADLARPTARRGRVPNLATEYMSGSDRIVFTYSDRSQGFRVALELDGDIARRGAAITGLKDAGATVLSTDGVETSFDLADAEAVEVFIRDAFPVTA